MAVETERKREREIAKSAWQYVSYNMETGVERNLTHILEGTDANQNFLSVLMAIFQVNLDQLVFIQATDDGGGGDNWSYKTCKAPVKSSPPTNQHPVFIQVGCPSCRPTNSIKALKGKISHSMDLLTPNSPGVFQLCLWPLIAPDYLGGGLPCLSSALWSQYPKLRLT